MLKSGNKKKQLKQQQDEMRIDKAKTNFEVREFESKSDDGAVVVIATGQRAIKSLSIGDELIAGDKDQLIATVLSVTNEALSLAREANIQLTTEVAKQFNKDNKIESRSGVKN